MGAESRAEFDEPFAPSEEWGSLLGHSLFFYSKDAGHPVEFVPPSYALDDITTIPHYRSFNTTEYGTRLWWLEYGGRLHTIHDTEQIKWELWRIVYGIWNHLKNSGEHPEAENLTLEWVGLIPGRRESRRFEGHYMLRQQDIVDQTEHPDAVAFGGWGIDLHPADGIFSEHIYHPESFILFPRGTYQIPYRCLVSRNIPNLFLAGRVISASHVAFGSTRVMGTGAHMGQAVGMAAAICAREGLRPADLLAPAPHGRAAKGAAQGGSARPGGADSTIPPISSATRRCPRPASSSSGSCPRTGPPSPSTGPAPRCCRCRPGRCPRSASRSTSRRPPRCAVEARTSDRPYNHTPDVVLAARDIDLEPGAGQEVEIAFDVEIDEPRYVFVCLMENEHVAVGRAASRATGLLAVAHTSTQEPDDAVGQAADRVLEFRVAGRRDLGAARPRLRRAGTSRWRLDPPVSPFGPGQRPQRLRPSDVAAQRVGRRARRRIARARAAVAAAAADPAARPVVRHQLRSPDGIGAARSRGDGDAVLRPPLPGAGRRRRRRGGPRQPSDAQSPPVRPTARRPTG